ncbi:uncharacterized protein BP01DRAFT_391679 [Aspergillus saccharolyticus JOP 1030-1]|uniref:Uncharacterized protein n=1 Tax=Aspergillus saccharolyticus JOP 1030-1 TaxID=1450539 RepID=A0A318ZDS8_9EURO|nr:hypothetical protein BP01DRAFT_391679 [Aspergillus saccharolyticus JOP 1030-1]PYH45519.1 hypothetical protein BP01DRAFT_391679 [Aspergillus saccharolyticus JOP 1030-1]
MTPTTIWMLGHPAVISRNESQHLEDARIIPWGTTRSGASFRAPPPPVPSTIPPLPPPPVTTSVIPPSFLDISSSDGEDSVSSEEEDNELLSQDSNLLSDFVLEFDKLTLFDASEEQIGPGSPSSDGEGIGFDLPLGTPVTHTQF